MSLEKLQQDLEFIRKTMETSTRYRHTPPAGDLAAGLVATLGMGASALAVGVERLLDVNGLSAAEVWLLAPIWLATFVLALGLGVFFTLLQARRLGRAAWNPLAARMFLSQIPQVLMAGVLSVACALHHDYQLIPAVWLLVYGLILHSFSYFTKSYHRLQGLLFMLLGVATAFAPASWAAFLLWLGFGGLHIGFGVLGLARQVRE